MPIEVKHLTHTYGVGSPFQSTAVNDVTLTIGEGEFLAIVGHTGSGKSTFVQHLNGLLEPTSGEVLIDGENMFGDKKERRRIRSKVGLVFQYPEYQLFEETIAKDIAFGPKNQGLSAEEIDARVRRAMANVGLDYDHFAERSPFELSGGQMRRVAIAGVLAMEPKYLILDEPTAGLDPRGRDSILDMIRNLHAQGGTTVLMVSHSMDDVARLAEKLIVMSRGSLVAYDTPREVFRQREMMESIGLGVPEAASLAAKLREKGIPVAEGLYTQTELRDELLRLWKEASGC